MDHDQKKQKKVIHDGPDAAEEGDAWIYTAVKRGSYLFPVFSIGKWTQDTCRSMIYDFRRRLSFNSQLKAEVFTDGNDDYTYAFRGFFPQGMINYGQLVKIRDSRGKLIGKERRIIYGNPDEDDIDTINVENFNGILRERVGRLVRKTKCFSKKKYRLICAVSLFQFYWNFMSEIRRGRSPAMLESLSENLWTWHDFFYAELTHLT